MSPALRLARPARGLRADWARMRQQARLRGPVWLLAQAGLTLLALWIVWRLGSAALGWVFEVARWSVVSSNLQLFAIGAYPRELAWRPALALLLVGALIGFSAEFWGSILRDFARLLIWTFGTLLVLPLLAPIVAALGGVDLAGLFAAFGAARGLLLTGLVVTLSAGRLARQGGWLVQRVHPKLRRRLPRGRSELSRALRLAWIASLPLILLLLDSGSSGPSASVTEGWGGLLLTLVLAAGSIALSFPLGLLLALGRRSRLPLVKLLCVLFIELVRGLPLVTLLYMAGLLLPLIMPAGLRPNDVLRAMAGLTCFAAAYLAEDIRGGLASVGAGQYEAARALGLGSLATHRLVILPQALRAVIPAIVGQFISLFKDTSLAIIIGLRELLGIARTVTSQPEHIGLYREALSFIAILYFVFSFAISRASRRLERELDGAGR